MLTLIPTWGSASANVYAGLADANSFITDEFLDSKPWAEANTEQRTRALAQATRDIDTMNWHGQRYFYRQALAYPRVPTGIGIDPYGPYAPGAGATESDANFFNFLEQDEYLNKQHRRVMRACAIQAVHLLRNAGRHLDREAQFTGLASQSTGRAGISESYSYAGIALKLHPDAFDLLRYYRVTPRLVRGSGPDPAYE